MLPPEIFFAFYVVCGRTDFRFGIDSLAAIIETKYHLPIFVPNTLFLFCGRSSGKIKGLVWEGDGFLLFTKRVEEGHFTWPRNSAEQLNAINSQLQQCIAIYDATLYL